jgi:hypothetical protein
MQSNSFVDQIRSLVESKLSALDRGPKCEVLREKILIRDGNYCGHRFMHGGVQAVWFIEENQIKIYGPNGRVQEVMTVQPPLVDRRAA